MKRIFFAVLACISLCARAQVAVNLPPSQLIDPLAAFQVHGAARIDTIPDASIPTYILVLDQHDSLIHKISFYDFISYIQLNAPAPIVHVYTTDAVWAKPPGLKYIVVEMVGGGGGGAGGGISKGQIGGGGGAGGYTRKIIPASVLNSTENIVVGIGGTGGPINGGAGTNGSFSSFGTFCSATGGNGAQSSVYANAPGGTGGIGTGGDINITGSGGAGGGIIGSGIAIAGGLGGSSFFGGGAAGSAIDSNGWDGSNYGGGGSGGSYTNTTRRYGGNGASGVVIITEQY